MKLLLILGLLAVAQSVPQRFRQRGLPRRGRQEPGGGYLAPAAPPAAPDSYVTPAAEAPALYSAPEETEAAADEVDSSYLAPVAAAAELDNAYLAPAEDYSADYSAPEADSSYLAPAPSDEIPVYEEETLDTYEEEPLDTYEEEPLEGYNEELDAAASDAEAADPLKMLMNAVPGVPGEDYPIYAETPETAFSCDGQVDGGYYADEEAQCQVFHICTADGAGGLAKYSFLCPNGTIFNQNYFICDWWFNVDCAESAAIAEAKNSEVAGAREAASAAASDAVESYAAPVEEEAASDLAGGYLAPEEESEESSEEDDYYYDDQAGYGGALSSYNRRF